MNFNIGPIRYLCGVFIIILLACKPSMEAPIIDTEKPITPIAKDTNFFKGADISWVTEMESKGIKFYNKNGIQTE